MVKNKSKPSLGFGDDLEEILENPEATVDDANGQEVEYTRNLMYKIILTPHTQDVKKRFRKEHGRLASVPLYYESLNDFIRDVILKEAKRVLGAEKYNLTLGKPFNQTKVKLSEEEHQKLSEQRKAERKKNK